MSKPLEAFGKYLLLEKLAAGGMAEVFLAKSVGANGIGKLVAMKRILPQFTDNQEFVEMFKEEAKLVMNLNHGNIVSIYDFGIERNQFFLIMEFVEGQNLRQTLNHLKKNARNLTIDQVVYIIKEVAAGLDHAHRCVDPSTSRNLNITHRDISPQNIMISFEGEVKVVDFGIAKAESQIEHTRAGTIKGKFGYMSPEQAEGQNVDRRTDIFSLGIVLWELLANERLFTAQSEQATLRKIKECQVPSIRKLNPAVHPDLEKIVAKSLERDKANRFQEIESLAKDLSKFLNTHYPEFSKQEFSKFMKSAYSDMYLDNRKKFAEFAKLSAQQHTQTVTMTEKTSITQTATNTKTAGPVRQQTNATDSTNGVHDTESNILKNNQEDLMDQGLISPASERIDLSKLAINSRKPITSNRAQNSIYSPRPLNPPNSQVRSGTFATGTYSGTSSSIQVNKQSSGSWLTPLFLVAILAGGIYWYFDNQKTIQRNEASVKLSDPLPPVVEEQTDVPLSIQSSPSEAKIYIDDQLVGETPYRSHIDRNRTFRLRLYLSGYNDYELSKEKAKADGYHKIVNLLPEAASGWLQIEAVTAEPQSYIVINGRRLTQSLKEEVKVPAGASIILKVVNPIAKMEGTVTVIVGDGERKKVKVLINRTAQVTP